MGYYYLSVKYKEIIRISYKFYKILIEFKIPQLNTIVTRKIQCAGFALKGLCRVMVKGKYCERHERTPNCIHKEYREVDDNKFFNKIISCISAIDGCKLLPSNYVDIMFLNFAFNDKVLKADNLFHAEFFEGKQGFNAWIKESLRVVSVTGTLYMFVQSYNWFQNK